MKQAQETPWPKGALQVSPRERGVNVSRLTLGLMIKINISIRSHKVRMRKRTMGTRVGILVCNQVGQHKQVAWNKPLH